MRRFLLGRFTNEVGLNSPLILYVRSMISKDLVKDIVVRLTKETAIFLVEIKVSSANKISVEIDSPQGITIEECVKMSRAIESSLDRDTEDFDLEVSSPGLTQPFRVFEQYQKNCGQQVDVVKLDGQKVNGLLQYADTEGITLEISTKIKEAGQKRPRIVMQPLSLRYSEIKTTKLALNF